MDIRLVIFDFDDTLVRGQMAKKSRSKHLNPLSNDPAARNRMIANEFYDADGFVDLVHTLTARGIEVAIGSFGSPLSSEWYSIHSPTK